MKKALLFSGITMILLKSTVSFSLTQDQVYECAKDDVQIIKNFKSEKDFFLKGGELLSQVIKVDDESISKKGYRKLQNVIENANSCKNLRSTLNQANVADLTKTINKWNSQQNPKLMDFDDLYMYSLFMSESHFEKEKSKIKSSLKEMGLKKLAMTIQYKHAGVRATINAALVGSAFGGRKSFNENLDADQFEFYALESHKDQAIEDVILALSEYKGAHKKSNVTSQYHTESNVVTEGVQ